MWFLHCNVLKQRKEFIKNTSLVMEDTNVLEQGTQNSSNIKEGDNMCNKQENNSSSNNDFMTSITKQLQETISSNKVHLQMIQEWKINQNLKIKT
jgi:hypothetical protein